MLMLAALSYAIFSGIDAISALERSNPPMASFSSIEIIPQYPRIKNHSPKRPSSSFGIFQKSSRSHKSSSSSKLYFFDNFVRPYGVPPNNRTNSEEDEMNQTRVELLDAMLPKKHEGQKCSPLNTKSRSTELFQRARLAEQLRLSKRGGMMDPSSAALPLQKEITNQETFQRALLEEQLRLQLKQKQFENSMREADDLLKLRMVNDSSNGSNDEGSNAKKANEISSSVDSKSSEGNGISTFSTSNASGGIHNTGGGGNARGLNDTEAARNLHNKLNKLKEMTTNSRSTSSSVTPEATSSPITTAVNDTATITTTTPTTPIEKFLATTHLPMPPSENAALLSLALAPFAHLLTSFVLFGMTGVYAVCAIIDVLVNDDGGLYSSPSKPEGTSGFVTSINDNNNANTTENCGTRQCLREAGCVWRSAWDNVFGVDHAHDGPFARSMESLKASAMALFYAIQVVLVRAAKHSQFANETLDAGTGALRYFVYSLRSVNALWQRLWNGVENRKNTTNEGIEKRGATSAEKKKIIPRITTSKGRSRESTKKNQKLKRKVDLFRVFAEIQKSATKRLNQEHSIKLQQQRARSEQEYREKMMTLNSDRVFIERERRAISEERQQLEQERRKLMCEMFSVMAWYAMLGEAQASIVQKEDNEMNKKEKKRGWRFRWFGRGRGYDDDSTDERTWMINIDENDDDVSHDDGDGNSDS